MAMTSRLVSATVAALLAVGVSLAAQRPQLTFRSTINLVRVDASVVDEDGNPIEGLTAKDFTLLDRGVRQPIAAFEEVRHEPRSIAPLGHQDVASNLVDSRSEMMVLVLDDEHIRKEWTDHAREIVEDFVRELNDDTLVALFSTSGRYRVELTADRQRILDALDGFMGREPRLAYIAPAFAGLALPPKPVSPGGSPGKPPPPPPSVRGGCNQGHLEGVPFDSPTLFATLGSAAKVLGSDQSRHKALAWISTGEAFSAEGLTGAVSRMREAGVATYAIDPVGTANVIPDGDYTGAGCPSFVWAPVNQRTPWQVSADNRHASLVTTARLSGGEAIVNTDDFGAGVRKIAADFGRYYTLGFYPDDTTTPGVRPLDVWVSRLGVTVHARQSYSLADAVPAAPEKALPALVSGLVPRGDLPMRLFAATLPPDPPRSQGRVVVTLEVTAPVGALATPAGRLEDELTYGVFAFDTHTGQVVSSVSKKADVRLSAHAAGVPPDAVYAVETALALPPGHYQIRASGRSAKTGAAGSVYALVDMPDYRQALLAVGDIVVGDSNVPLAKSTDTKAAARLATLSFAPTLERVFAVGDRIRVYTEIAGGGADSPINGTVTLVDARGTEVWHADQALSAANPRRLDLAVVIPPLATGSYGLRVSATDGAHTAVRDVAVTIR